MSDINVIVNDEIVNIDVIDEPVLVNVINSPGVPGAPGQGVPVGGTTGQVLAKNSATNYDTEWVDVSGGAWGTITGTLSNQTDLQNALNAKFDDPTGTTAQYLRGDGSLATFPSLTGYVPYTGATGDVDLGTHRILAQNATIASSGSGDTATINHSSGSGIGLNITKGGNGEGLYINKTGGSGNAATIIGTLNATTLVKSGGTSSQFLKADGTVDSSVYVPTSREITINGVTFDLSANRTFTVGSVTGSGASGQVAYWTGTTSQAGSNNLFWDNANGRLGIGTNTPSSALQIVGGFLASTNSFLSNNINSILTFGVSNTSTTTAAAEVLVGNASRSLFFGRNNGASFSSRGVTNVANTDGYLMALFGGDFIILNQNGNLNFAASGSSIHAKLFTTGNLLLQNGGTFTDGGQRLQVQGTTLLNGNVTFSSATGMFWDATNNRLGIGTNAPSTTLTVAGGLTLSSGILSLPTAIHTVFDGKYRFWFQGQNRWTFDSLAANQGYNFLHTATSANAFNITNASGSQFLINGAGNVLINSSTDSGERLQVTGTMKVTGNVFAGTGSPTSFYLRNATVSGTSGDIGLGIFNSSTTGTAGFILGQSNTAYGTITKWGSTYAGNYAGTSLALADSFQIQTGSTNNTTLVIQGNPIVLTPGLTSTNVGIRNDTTSVRITTLANVHTSGTALLDLDVSTTTRASLRIRSGTAPTSPNDGDIWFDGTDIKMRIGGVTKTFTLL